MNFWIAGAALTALTTLALVVPALRARSRREFAGQEQAVYRDQLEEVDRDEQRGLISGAEAEAARAEIKRRMLKAAERTDKRADASGQSGRWVIVAAALAVPVLGVAIYGRLGHPEMPSAPFADRADERATVGDMNVLVKRLRERLVSDPQLRPEGWLMLARTYMEMGQPEEAEWAMSTLIQRGGDQLGPDVYAIHAEILINMDDGIVSPKAEAALDKALGMDPEHVAATYYKALALEQSGEMQRAYEMLKARVEAEKTFQPWMKPFARRADMLAQKIGAEQVVVPQAAPGPTAGDVAAASEMTPEERQDFIRSMVQRLADSLAEQPDDLDGWLRLGNAYRVLGEAEKNRWTPIARRGIWRRICRPMTRAAR
ncbi:c-type cytochrome biogenesis protein CcmI [Jhaorihella thermophila]